MNRSTLILVLIGLAIRLLIIFPGPFESKVGFLTNYADLRNYYWPAQTALRGENPYELWASGKSGEYRADMAPLELSLYVATLTVWNDPRAIQLLFAFADIINIILLGALLRRSSLDLPFQIFYALSPLTIYNFVFVAQDKTILLTLTFALYLLTQHAIRNTQSNLIPIMITITAALIASFKWLSIFYLFPLVLFISSDIRAFIKYGIIFAMVVAVAHLPWIPDWLYVYTFRFGRVDTPTVHIAPAVLLNALGLYNKTMMTILVIVILAVVYALFWRKRIDIFETIALSVAAGVLWTPDMDPVHLGIVVIHFLLVMNWAQPIRMASIWIAGFIVALVYAVSTHTSFGSFNLFEWQRVTGAYGSPQMILWSYLLFVVVVGFYVFDKWRGRVVGRAVMMPEINS